MIAMDKYEIARTLEEISRYLELSEANRFKALAFERAARALRSQDRDVDDLIATGALIETPGIGKATATIIEELARSGQSQYLDELRARFPPGIFELLRVPNLGLKKIGILHEALGVGSLDDLEAAAKANKLTTLRDFGGNVLRTTGTAEFVEAFGKIAKARKEEDLFTRAGFAYVPPERRETADDLRRKRARPLVTLDSLRGTFHVHTTFSDGRNTVLEMLSAAREREFEYVGLSD